MCVMLVMAEAGEWGEQFCLERGCPVKESQEKGHFSQILKGKLEFTKSDKGDGAGGIPCKATSQS